MPHWNNPSGVYEGPKDFHMINLEYQRLNPARIAPRVCGWGVSSARQGECERCGGKWEEHQRPRECHEPMRKS